MPSGEKAAKRRHVYQSCVTRIVNILSHWLVREKVNVEKTLLLFVFTYGLSIGYYGTQKVWPLIVLGIQSIFFFFLRVYVGFT